jgi:hypothetical protein
VDGRQTDMTKLTVALCNFANVSNRDRERETKKGRKEGIPGI